MEEEKNIKELNYRSNIDKKTNTSDSAILSFILALLGIKMAIECFYRLKEGNVGDMWWELSLIIEIVIVVCPISAIAIVMGIKGFKNPYKWMAISGFVIGILSVIIEIITLIHIL